MCSTLNDLIKTVLYTVFFVQFDTVYSVCAPNDYQRFVNVMILK